MTPMRDPVLGQVLKNANKEVATMSRKPVSILFICTGNICRSPLAQGVCQKRAEDLGKDVILDSAATGAWHEGEAPDPRAIAAAKARGIDISRQRARAITDEDFTRFDYLVGMDEGHRRWMRQARTSRGLGEKPMSILLDWSVGMAGQDVPDPYYGGPDDFEKALDLIEKGVDGLLRRI